MKTKANDLAMSRPYSHDERPSGGYEGDRPETFQAQEGLTKREYFAAMAMQGLLNNPNIVSALNKINSILSEKNKDKFTVSRSAKIMADALIDELNKDE